MQTQIQIGGPPVELIADEQGEADRLAIEAAHRAVRIDFGAQTRAAAQAHEGLTGGSFSHGASVLESAVQRVHRLLMRLIVPTRAGKG
jgi:hypothetical protein